MTSKNLASLLQGREYAHEVTKEIAAMAKDSNLVIVHGSSDDMVELRGAIEQELEAWNGITIYLTPEGKLNLNEDHFFVPTDLKIDCIWSERGRAADWTIKSNIPHETFEIFEEGELFCRGIVFSLDNLNPS